jgi:hypothetical protein
VEWMNLTASHLLPWRCWITHCTLSLASAQSPETRNRLSFAFGKSSMKYGGQKRVEVCAVAHAKTPISVVVKTRVL